MVTERLVLPRAARAARSQCGAVTVEYALTMLLAAAILAGVELTVFRPMALDIFKDFLGFISPYHP